MAIQFPCSQCGRTLKVDNQFVGAKIRCPKCGAITRATATGHVQPKPAPAPAPPRPPAEAGKTKRATDAGKPKRPRRTALDTVEEIEPVAFKRRREEDELDMTPMVDVTFLLLIFFMVTAAFSLQKSLEIPKPSEDNAVIENPIENPEEGNIVVEVHADNTIWINESEAPSEQDLLVKLREAKMGVPGTDSLPINSVLVMADREAMHETVVMALDACNAVSMEKIKLATVSEDDF